MKRVVQSHRTKRGGLNLTLKILFFSLAYSSVVLSGWSPDQHHQHWLIIYKSLGPTPDLLETLEREPGSLSLNSFSRRFWCTLIFENHCFSLWASQVELVGKNLPANSGDVRDEGSNPGLGRFLGGGHGNSLQYSCLENPMNRGALWTTVHRVTKSRTRLNQLNMQALSSS